MRPERKRPLWLRLTGFVLSMTLLLPLYAFFATWLGYLITPDHFNPKHWIDHDLLECASSGLFVSLLYCPIFVWQERRRKTPVKPFTWRHWLAAVMFLIALPVIGQLWLRAS